MSALARIVVAAAVGGVVVGGAFGFFTAPDGEAATLALDSVPVYICPGEGEVGALHRGDRVFVTGRSGDWLAVRNVRGSGERVFVAAATVVPDADLSGLPEVACETAGSVEVMSSETTVADSTTTTVGDTTTTSSSTTTTSSTTSTTTTTTLPPPSVDSVSDNPDPVWEKYPGFPGTCPGDGITTISVAVSAPAGVQSVTVAWTTSTHGSGGGPMSGAGGSYSADIGPFDANGSENGPNDTITVTVTVIDGLGRDATGQTTVTLNDCTFS